MVSLLQNENTFTQLKCLRMNNCAEWWQRHREECIENFETLLNLIVACESLEEIDLSHNELNGAQIGRIIHAIRQSLSIRFL